MTHRYRVETVCAATIREVWTLSSRTPLNPAAIAAFMASSACAAGDIVELYCLEDATKIDEGDRVVTAVQSLGLMGES